MKVTVKTLDLLEAVKVAQKGVGKCALPILSYLKLSAEDSTLMVIGANLEQYVVARCKAKVDSKGDCCILPALLRIPVGVAEVTIETKADKVLIRYGPTVLKLDAKAVKDFPPLPLIKNALSFKLSGFASALKSVAHAMADGQARPVLNGVSVNQAKSKVEYVGADGFRLVSRSVKGRIPRSFIIPEGAVNIAKYVLGDAVTGIASMTDEGDKNYSPVVLLTSGNIDLYFRDTQGVFPNYQAIVPTGRAVKMQLVTAELSAALKTLPNVRDVKLRLVSKGSKLTVSVVMDDMEAETAVKCKGRIKVAVDAKYLLDMLSVLTGTITIESRSVSTPICVRGKDYIYLVMPLNVSWTAVKYNPYAALQKVGVAAESEHEEVGNEVPVV